MGEFQKRLIAVVSGFIFMLAFGFTNAIAAEDLFPDRCPEPCEIGGTNVSLDFQRLTTPFRIRNSDSGNYLKVGIFREVTAEPLVENDDSFLWVLLPSVSLDDLTPEVSDMIRENGFEKRFYKLINLKESLALMGARSQGLPFGNRAPPPNQQVSVDATDLSGNQFWLLQKVPNDRTNSKYLIFNPKVETPKEPKFTFGPDIVEQIKNYKPIFTRDFHSTKIVDSMSSKSAIPALRYLPRQKYVAVNKGANIRAPGFTWQFEQAQKPKDLARLTVHSIRAIEISKGWDDSTEDLMRGVQYAADYGPMVFSLGAAGAAKASAHLASTAGERAAKKAAKEAAVAAGEAGFKANAKKAGAAISRGAKAAANKAKSLKGAIGNAFKKNGTKVTKDQASLARKAGKGLLTVGAAPFRAMFWLTKTAGSAAVKGTKGLVKLGATSARGAADIAKRGAKSAVKSGKAGKKWVVGYAKKNADELETKAAKAMVKGGKFAANQVYEVLEPPYAATAIVDPSQENENLGSANNQASSDADSRKSYNGKRLEELKQELADQGKAWGGDLDSFSSKADKLKRELFAIDPDYYFSADDYTNKYWPLDMDYEPDSFEQTYGRLFEGAEERDYLLKGHKTHISNTNRDKRYRERELAKRKSSLGQSKIESEKELRDLKRRVNEVSNKAFILEKLARQIEEIEAFERGIQFSEHTDLVLAGARRATYLDEITVTEEKYRVCSETKSYAVPQSNQPYFRLGSSQNVKALSEKTKEYIEDWSDGSDVSKKLGLLVFDTLTADFTPLFNSMKSISENTPDDVEIQINGTSVWPNGGLDNREVSGGQLKNVGVEYVFQRGDDVTIELKEVDGNSKDSLGQLKIPTNHLYDIENYNGAYIQKASEGSLYEVSFTVEPLYIPTREEIKTKRIHDANCDEILKQADAENFAAEVEQTRIEGRLALLNHIEKDSIARPQFIGFEAEDGLRAFDNQVYWSDVEYDVYDNCQRTSNFDGILEGEWRVGRFDKDGNRDLSSTWTNTFSRDGVMVTPTHEGRWSTESISPGRNTSVYVGPYVNDKNSGWEVGAFQSADDVHRSKTSDTCEIYAAMYDEDGFLGGRGKRFIPETGLEEKTEYYDIAKEYQFAVRGIKRNQLTPFDGAMYQIANKSSMEHKAISFLRDYYQNIPERKHGVESNLHLTASGPREFWLEKISDTNVSKGTLRETKANIDKIKDSISGSWEIGTYKSKTKYPQRKELEDVDNSVIARLSSNTITEREKQGRRIWTFAPDGTFIEKPKHDFWFRPQNLGTWKYIGDQRIEVTTNADLKLISAQLNEQDDYDAYRDNNLGTTFIVKMAQKPNDPTEFTGFYVQGESGKRVIWSEQIHPGQTPYQAPEYYTDSYFELLSSRSESWAGNTYFAQREERIKSDKSAKAAKLAELTFASQQSPCTFVGGGYFSWFPSPASTAFQGNWRVGQYDTKGEKIHTWNYRRGNFTPLDYLDSPERVRTVAPKVNEWRPKDVSDRYRWDRDGWSSGSNEGNYQQEWRFPEYPGEVTVRTKLGSNAYSTYEKGDLAPPFLNFNQVYYSQSFGTFRVGSKKLSVQHVSEEEIKLAWDGGDCRSSSIKLPDQFGNNKSHDINFIYHENGDKEFYITKPDGSLHLWGLKETDKTEHSYKYDLRLLTDQQAAAECYSRYTWFLPTARHPFDYYDRGTMRGNGKMSFDNKGLKPIYIIDGSGALASGRNYPSLLKPGQYQSFTPPSLKKLSVMRYQKQYDILNVRKSCIGRVQQELGASGYPKYFKIGEGFVAPTKHTDDLKAREACAASLTSNAHSGNVRANSYAGSPATIEFKNNGSIPLEIYRLGSDGEKLSRLGESRGVSPDDDPNSDFDNYYDVHRIVKLEPGKSHKLRSMTGHAFTAIKRGNRHIVKEYNVKTEKLWDKQVGESEICYGAIKITDRSETVEFSDELSLSEFYDHVGEVNRKYFEDISKAQTKIREDKRIANNLSLISDANLAPNTVLENAAAGTRVGITSLAIDGDENDSVRYSASSEAFGVNAVTGEVFVQDSSHLDREHEYRRNINKDVHIIATSSDGSESRTIFKIGVEDANEFGIGELVVRSEDTQYVPAHGQHDEDYVTTDVFDEHEVSEATPELLLISAKAEDRDATATVRYSLSDDSDGIFAINPEHGAIYVAGKLDYEQKSRHSITVVATSSDGSQSEKTTTIVVLNHNDGPVDLLVDSDPAPNTFMEGAPDGTPVGIVAQATDPDTGDKLTYLISPYCGCREFYDIDPNTGVVTARYDYRINLEGLSGQNHGEVRGAIADASHLEIWVKSSDGSQTQTSFEIEILDRNEYEISTTKNVSKVLSQVAENSAPGTPVGVTAHASDKDVSANISYQLSDDANGRFEIDQLTGAVSLKGDVDYENAQDHAITVVSASSDGTTSQETFIVDVLNVSEFEIGEITDIDPATNTVAEGRWNSTDLRDVGVTAQAKDPDFGEGVTYSLEGGRLGDGHNGRRGMSYADGFAIDVGSGVVSVWGSHVDFESSPILSFVVIATSVDGSTSEAEFSIDVTNVNEYSVASAKDTDTATNQVSENAQPGALVGITATALDADGDVVTYALNNSGTYRQNDSGNYTHEDGGTYTLDTKSGIFTLISGPEKFTIDSQTGVVTVAGELNTEDKRNETFDVMATSSDGSRSRETFSVGVVDVNEFDVAWEEKNFIIVTVGESANIGDVVTLRWVAEDKDVSDKLTFSLMNDNDVPFTVDPKWGDVKVSRSLKEPYVASYELDILVTSSDGTKARKSFVIPVEDDVNEFSISEMTDSDPAISSVDENVPVGTLVGITAFAVDEDGSDTVEYSIESGHSFAVDKESGVVTVAGNLDHEQGAVWDLKISAVSSDGSKTVGSFTVDVADINEFTVGHFIFGLEDKDSAYDSIDENAAPGTLVGITAFANDEDGTDEVTYRLINDAGGRFVIDSETGVVSVSQNPGELDLEALDANSSGYYIDIAADSSDGSTINSELLIMLNDINEFDISAVIDTDDTPNEVDEFAEYGTLVGITAFSRDGDGDQDKNYVSYSIVEVDGLGRAFTIGQHTGVVKVTNMTNYDSSKNSPFIRVLATGADGSTSEEDFYVTIRLLARWYDDPQGPRVEADYPKVSEVDRNICVAADDDVYSKATFNNENAYFDCMDSYVPVIQRWYDNPQGPRVEADFPYVSEADRNICVAADDDENAPETFNNERLYFNCLERAMPTWRNNPQGPRDGSDVPYQRISEEEWAQCDAADTNINSQTYNNENAFFDCLDSFVPPIERWYDNPQGPRVEADFPGVSEEDRNICIAADDDVSAHYTFNNERAYFDCLASYVPAAPEVQKWRDNPQGPRYEEDYAAVSQEAINYCRYYDEEPTSPTFNNENAYFDCLTPYLPVVAPSDTTPTNDVAGDPVQQPADPVLNDAPFCARQYGLEPEYSDQTGVMTFVNNSEDYVEVHQINADGTSTQLMYLEYGQSTEITSPRRLVHVGFDPNGNCIGAGKMKESQGRITFPTDTAPTDDVVSDPVQQPVDPVLNDAPFCARQYGLEPEYSDQTGVMTFVNNSEDYVEVHQINADGTSTQLMYLEYGQSTEITSPRRLVHVGFDPNGNCIGAGKMKESQGRITFPTDTAPTDDVVSDPVQQPVDPVLNDAPLCARQYGLEPEYSNRTVDNIFVNNSDSNVEVHQVNADGTSTQLMYLEYGQSIKMTTPRRVVHVGFDPNGKCIGAGKMVESAGRITFGE